MKKRIRNKILKQFAEKHQLKIEYVREWATDTQWIPQSASMLRARLRQSLSREMDYYYTRYYS